MQTKHQANMLQRVSHAAYMTAAVRVTAVSHALTACHLVHCTSVLMLFVPCKAETTGQDLSAL